MDVNRTAIELAARALEGSHRALLALTGGRWPHRLAGMQLLELHTIGRRTGQRRSTMLSTPIHDEGRLILVASKGGHPENPLWYENLVANPKVEITIEGSTTEWTARTATPEERAELWPRITEVSSNYAGYQKRADREIPVVICERRRD